jgi:hypothetical protein
VPDGESAPRGGTPSDAVPGPPQADPFIEPPDVRTVRTAIELQLAVTSGDRDIEVVEHLDLRELDLLNHPGTENATYTMYTGTNTRSIRVCCFSCQCHGLHTTTAVNSSG